MSAELLALAERVEAATGPDRELDALIAIEMFDGGADHLDDPRDVTRARSVIISHGARPGNFEVVGFSGVSLQTAADYTASLDAAMTLVPDQHIAGLLHHVLRDIQRTGFADSTFLQRLIIGVVGEALRSRALAQSQDRPQSGGREG